MLYEISHLRQSNRSLVKRWFTSYDMDLFVWFRNNAPVRFQLCFDKRSNEHAICWDFQRKLQLYQVDSGETFPDQYKKTPILTDSYSQENLPVIARNFLAASENIDIGIADFIYARLMEYPAPHARRNVIHINRPVVR